MGALCRAVTGGWVRRHRGAHRAQLPSPLVPVPRLQQANRRVRGLVREQAPLRARGDRRGTRPGGERLGGRSSDHALGLHPRRPRRRRRGADGPPARSGRQGRLRERQRSRLPQHPHGDPAVGRARRVSRRARGRGEERRPRPARVHDRRHQGSGDGRRDRRLRQGGHGRHDPHADRRPRVCEQGPRRARGRDLPLHPREPGLHRTGVQGHGDQLHGEPGRRAGGPLRNRNAHARGEPGALARRRRRPRGDEGCRDARQARPPGDADRARGGARRAGQPHPADAGARDVRLDHEGSRPPHAKGGRRDPARRRGVGTRPSRRSAPTA